jgi:hypothetical protein
MIRVVLVEQEEIVLLKSMIRVVLVDRRRKQRGDSYY